MAPTALIIAAGVILTLSVTALVKYEDKQTTITCWGDSLTAGTTAGVSTPFPSILQKKTLMNFNIRKVSNQGIEGMTSTQVASKFGAKPPILFVDQGVIPSKGSVLISKTEASNLSSKSDYYKLKYKGELSGVKGVLSVRWNEENPDCAGETSFKRNKAGASVEAPDPVPFLVETNGWENNVSVIWVGRNDIISKIKNEEIIHNIDLMVRSLSAHNNNRFVILGVTDALSENIESSEFKQIVALNNELSRRYKDNWIDIREALITGYTDGVSKDINTYRNNKIPAPLFADGLHLNDKGYEIVADTVHSFIKARDW